MPLQALENLDVQPISVGERLAMLEAEAHHLEKRRQRFFVVVTVPEALRSIIGKRRLIKTTEATTLGGGYARP